MDPKLWIPIFEIPQIENLKKKIKTVAKFCPKKYTKLTKNKAQKS